MQISPIHKIEEAQAHKQKEIKSGGPPNTTAGQGSKAQTIEFNKITQRLKFRRRNIECMTFREATMHIYTNEGPRGFLRGLVPSLIKNSVMTGQYFSILFYME